MRAIRAAAIAVAAAAAAAAGCGSAAGGPEPGDTKITVAITSPEAGAELVAADHPAIKVTGTVATSDPSRGKLEAWVNGRRVELHDGAFSAEITPEPGINHIRVDGGDGLTPLVGQQLDVLWAPTYVAPLPGQTGFDVSSALELQLGQRFFDARLLGTTLDRTTDPVIARDIASALELVLWHVDLAALVDGGIHLGQGGASLDITIPAVTPTNIAVDAKIVDGAAPGLDVTVDLSGVFIAMNGSFAFGNTALAVAGGVTADLRATARLTLGSAADGSIDVGVTGVTASLSPLVPAFTGPDGDDLDGLILVGSSDFRSLVEGLLANQLIPTFTDRVPPLLESLLGAADQLLDGVSFTLDPGLGSPVTLQLDGHIGALDVHAGPTTGHVTVRQDLSIRTSGAASGTPLHPTSHGAARLDPGTTEPVLNAAGLHLAIRQDLLNALLHALWNAGMLDGQLADGALGAKISARLPPVVRATPASSACAIDGERCDVVVQLGQIDLELGDFHQTFGVSAQAGARIAVTGGNVSLVIQSEPELRVWETSATPGTFSADAVRDLIAKVIWPKLFGALGDKLTIALPLPDLASLGLGDVAPGLANAQLSLETRQRPSVTGGEVVLGADLILATPPPP